MDTGTDTMHLLYADGSGYKRRPSKSAGKNNRGEVRISFGVEKTGRIRPIGAWSGEKWENIASDVKGEREENQQVAEIFIGDGEPGLIDALAMLCESQQRCHWHAVRDLNFKAWKDGAILEERKEMQSDLAGILELDIPEEDFKSVKEEDKRDLAEKAWEAEKKVEVLQRELNDKGYAEAAGYVKRLKRNLFVYMRRWLETGLVCPRAASWIERTMREVARRLKRIAFGWSEKGAAKMARIVIKRFLNKSDWDEYWKNKLRLEGNVKFLLRGISLCSPTISGR